MHAPTFIELQDEVLSRSFVGRETELGQIDSALDAVAIDPAAIRLFLIYGSAGIGKRDFSIVTLRARSLAFQERVVRLDTGLQATTT